MSVNRPGVEMTPTDRPATSGSLGIAESEYAGRQGPDLLEEAAGHCRRRSSQMRPSSHSEVM